MSNLVAVVGRPNVGKSTLFNRIIGEKKAIIDDISGVTRDRIYGQSTWNGREFSIVDTGGFVRHSDDVFETEIRSQVKIAIEEADVIIFLVDVTTGITDLDSDVADMLRAVDKPVIVVVNKVDNYNRQLEANEFWSLGFERTFFMSSLTGAGSGEVLDEVVELLPEGEVKPDKEIPRLAIVGQPNVGKSSMVNTLLGVDRNIVTDIAGTTRDSIHTYYNKFDKEFYLVDTAGIRKKSKVHEDLEFYSVLRAIRAIDESDVCALMIDATMGIEAQDMKLFRIAQARKKGIFIVVNKWDLVEKETNTARDFEKTIKERLRPFDDVPVLFTSATEKIRVMRVLDTALNVFKNKAQKFKTSELNKVLLPIIERTPPPTYRGNFIKIKYITQLPLSYPAFAFFCNHPREIKQPYRLFLENKLRETFNFTGVPIAVVFKQK
ncbi:ribosome biogenesis GTPase Der [Membranicola marinus]|uniref:GTPase Der n=1 Tax=Membranihabitans marinus TaxID=1227546 RepID=A0A953I2L3_9BACT|nr:ribosome biogenesis GTPase Der [Membranihabitans marinus]MBY5960092.1 ribosome biogenesis GTPase Der [Membranihabitans marinus]